MTIIRYQYKFLNNVSKQLLQKGGNQLLLPIGAIKSQLELYTILLSLSYFQTDFRNKDVQLLLREGWKTTKIAYELKKENSHYDRLTEESVNRLFFTINNSSHIQ